MCDGGAEGLEDHDACCAPSASAFGDARPRDAAATGEAGQPPAPRSAARPELELVTLGSGAFLMGTAHPAAYPSDGEGPVREVTLRPFAIAPATVTNAEFAAFVDGTGYVTDAERHGWSFVFAGLLPDDFPDTRAAVRAQWWRQVFGADWRHPEGPQSDTSDRGDHPVVHVSWNDATTYCGWAGARLPTEAEWEYAARGGLVQQEFPWGDELTPGGEHRSNVWQGTFPSHNSVEDGYYGTAPAVSFPANGYALYNMTGNVWEWCADWFDRAYHATAPRDNPTGPPYGDAKVIRGGSYLCHASYCFRYRVAARSASTADSSTGNMGFRVARDA